MTTKGTLRTVVVLACVGYIVWYFSANQDELAILRNLRAWVLAGLIALTVLYFLVHSARYQLVIRKCSGRPLPYPVWFRMYIVGRFLNLIVPQSGNLFRAYVLKAAQEVTYTNFVSALLAVAWMGSCFNLATAIMILILGSNRITLAGLPATAWLAMLVTTLISGPIAAYWLLRRIDVRFRLIRRVKATLEEVLRVILTTPLDATFLGAFFAVSAALLGLHYVLLYFTFAALHIEAGPEQILLFLVLAQMISYLNLTPGNIGVKELAFGVLGRGIDITMGEAILAALLMRAVEYVAVLAVALPMGAVGELRRQNVRGAHATSSVVNDDK